MKTDDKTKMKVIIYIDGLQPKLKGTIYDNELLSLRKKYIYKDVSFDELKTDVGYLKQIKKIIIQQNNFRTMIRFYYIATDNKVLITKSIYTTEQGAILLGQYTKKVLPQTYNSWLKQYKLSDGTLMFSNDLLMVI